MRSNGDIDSREIDKVPYIFCLQQKVHLPHLEISPLGVGQLQILQMLILFLLAAWEGLKELKNFSKSPHFWKKSPLF